MRTGSQNYSLERLFDLQKEFQSKIVDVELPIDDQTWFSYHIQAMMEELGEVLKADKRWKTHRNFRYEPAEKLDEIADIFITAINLALYSGFDAKELHEAVTRKICINGLRLEIEAAKNVDSYS